MNTYRPDANWWRSSFCGASAGCLEASRAGRLVLVQDSKLPSSSGGVIQQWTADEWVDLLHAVKLDVGHVAIDSIDGGVWFGLHRHESLRFTDAEWNAFVDGVRLFEFEYATLPSYASTLSGPTSSEGYDAGQPVGVGGGSNLAATGAGEPAVPPVPVAASWDPTSPQHAVIRAAVNWRKRIADAIARGAARVEVWADREDLALIEAVDGLPHIGEPAAPVAADDLLVCGHRAPYGRGPKSVESPCGQCGTWRAYAGPTRAESALRPGGESGDAAVPPVPVAAQPPEIHAGYPGSGLARCGAPIGALTVAPGEEFTCRKCEPPVAAQLPKTVDAVMGLVVEYGDACMEGAFGRAAALLRAIRAALILVASFEPTPRWGAGPLVKHVPETSAAPEVWSGAVAPGGYVCGAPDPTRPDGICGMPVESEPCSEHNPETSADSRLREAAVRAAGIGEADPVLRTPGTGSADPDVGDCPDCGQVGRYDGRVHINGRGVYRCACGATWQDVNEVPSDKGYAHVPGTGSAVPDREEIERRDRLAESWAEDD